MRVRKLSLSGIERTKLFLGYVGENVHTQIRFDASCIYADNPGARAGLTMQNPAGTVFPIVLDADGNEIIWNVSASDVAIAGNGSYQLTFTDNDEIIKTFIGQLFVLKSLTSAGDIPTPIENWIDQANQKLAEVEAATESIDNMDASATKLSPDSSPTVTVSDVDGHKHLAFGIPQGEKGEKGDKGDTYEVTPENIEEISSRVVQSATIEQYTEGMAEQVEAAQQYAKDAGDSATAADSSKKAAAQSAQAASRSATAAAGSASNAAQSATNAGNSASAASQSAQAASQSATNAAQSEQNAADSAQDAHDVLDSIPADYSTLTDEVTDLKSALTQKANNTNNIPLVWTANKTILRGGGDRDQTNVYATLDYIPIKAGQVLEMLVYCPGSADNVVFYNASKEVVGYTNNSTKNPITYTVTVDGYMRLSNSPSQIPTANTYVKITNAEYPSIMDLQGQITANDEKTVGLLSGADYTYNFAWTDNGYINTNDGISSSANFIYTPDYYPVIPGAVLDVNLYAVGVSDVAITFYNASKVALSPRVYTYGGQITVPQDAAFMRCSNNITQIPKNEAYVKSHIQNVPNLTYFNIDRETDILGESVKKTHVSTTAIRKTYKGNLNRQKRFLAIGFDDLRTTDISMIMPLFEKYRARATFNKVFYYFDANPTDLATTWRVFLGDHELGDHTFHHYAFPYFDPLWNGQDPANSDGNQVPFPTNDDFRADAGNGKNVFGKTLTSNVNIGGVSGVTWANLTDAQCQTIREAFSVMKNNALITILDPLYNKYFGTTGTSAGSWDSTTGKYTGGIYTGCATSANHEVWERINECIAAYMKCELGIDWDMCTWSRPGTNASSLTVTYDGGTYYDPAHQYLASPQSRFASSLTGKSRSWTDVLLAFGYKVSHDYPIYGDQNYKWMSRQMYFNASLSRRDAIATPTNKSVSYSQIANAYPESYFSGTKSKAAQMYDTDGQFRTFVENVRKNTANGMIHMEMIDSNDNYSFRVFFENVLRYCEVAGIEVITKAEAYDIAFNNIISDGNLIGNTELRNTASEFITDSTNMPTNPDGYNGSCSVSADDNGIPVLVTSGNTEFIVYGIPYGKIKYTADVKGSGTIKFYGCKNNVNMSAGYTSLMLLGTLTVDSASDYTHQTLEFTVPKAALQEYEPNYEGYGNRIMALKIVYSAGLNVKNIRAVKD